MTLVSDLVGKKVECAARELIGPLEWDARALLSAEHMVSGRYDRPRPIAGAALAQLERNALGDR